MHCDCVEMWDIEICDAFIPIYDTDICTRCTHNRKCHNEPTQTGPET